MSRRTHFQRARMNGRMGSALAWVLLVCVVAGMTARAKNIFEDDWTPPVVKSPPAAATQSVPVPTPVPTPGARETPAARATSSVRVVRPIPAKLDQANSRTVLKEVYEKELADASAPARRELARKLLEQAGKSADVPADQFVLLRGAMEAAREASDLQLCFRAVDAMALGFEVDPLPLKLEAVVNLPSRALPPAASLENCRAGLPLIEQWIDLDDYATASRLLAVLRPGPGGDPGMMQQFQGLIRQVDLLRVGAAGIAKERLKLKTSPDDPAANLAVGKFLFFTKGDWQRGLPMLAKGSDVALKALASADLAKPSDAAGQADVADQWWEVAAKEPGLMQKRLARQRAAYWYDSALHGLIGLRKTLSQQRLAEYHRVDEPELPQVAGKARFLGKSFEIGAEAHWVAVDFSVAEGKLYRIAASGQWTDSSGAVCGPDGVCPKEFLTVLGPQPGLTKQQHGDWYLGQYPRSALLARIGEEKLGFFVGADTVFLAPASGKLSFQMNDTDAPSAARSGMLKISIGEAEPKWLDALGAASIVARIDDTDMLHVTAEGIYWEWGGHWGKVGEHDGHYPTVINGILWWPKWTENARSELLKSSELRASVLVQLNRVEAKRGEVKLEQAGTSDIILRFKDFGLGSSQVGCVVTFTAPPGTAPPGRWGTAASGGGGGEAAEDRACHAGGSRRCDRRRQAARDRGGRADEAEVRRDSVVALSDFHGLGQARA